MVPSFHPRLLPDCRPAEPTPEERDPIRMSSDGDLRQWDIVLRRNVSHPPPGTCDCTSADTAIHAPGESCGKDEQNTEDHGGPVRRGRSKEVGRPSSGADVCPQHLTPGVDKVHASAAELWPRTSGTQRSPPRCTRKCRRRSARRRGQRSRLLKDTFELVWVNLARAFAKQSKYYNFVTASGVVTRETAFSNGATLCHPVPKVSRRN
jgi:hypothetical protein